MKSRTERGKQRFSLLLCLGLTIIFAMPTFGHRPILSSSASAQTTDAAGSIFKTTDGGRTWVASGAGIAATFINDIAIDPLSPNNVYAGGDRGVFRSTDGGNSWITPDGAVTFASVQALAIDPIAPSNLYALTMVNGAFKSTDRGINWARINNGLEPAKAIVSLAINPVNPSVLFLGTYQEIFRSTDGGANWTSVLKLPGTGDILFGQDLAVDPGDPSVVYAIASNRIFRSTDGGSNWKDISGPVFQPQRITITSANPSTVYVRNRFTNGSLFKSTDDGESWTEVVQNPAELNRFGVNQLVSDPSAASTLYAATSQGVFRSTDGGANWVDTGLAAGPVLVLAIDPRNPATLYAGVSGGTSPSDSPWITRVSLNGKKLVVDGVYFDDGAVILIDGVAQETTNTNQFPLSKLISKKAGKKVKKNPDVKLQVRNASGRLSQQLTVSQALD